MSTPKCKQCGGRTALISGYYRYEPDDEPYEAGVMEDAKIESGEYFLNGYKCDDCGHIQGLWHE